MQSEMWRLFCMLWCPAILLANAGLLSIGSLGTDFSDISIKIQNISFTKMHMKTSSSKWRPFCPGGDELIDHCVQSMGHHWIMSYWLLQKHMARSFIFLGWYSKIWLIYWYCLYLWLFFIHASVSLKIRANYQGRHATFRPCATDYEPFSSWTRSNLPIEKKLFRCRYGLHGGITTDSESIVASDSEDALCLSIQLYVRHILVWDQMTGPVERFP